jgi:UDP-2,3-diacylglucosamine pyrophosphatase LpxH
MKITMAFIDAFEEAVAIEARRRGADGVICGHIHDAADRRFHSMHYLNRGDWVGSCTAVARSLPPATHRAPLCSPAAGAQGPSLTP